jgi:hypothetical protein
MPQLYAALAADEARNALIFDDVLAALDAGRSPLVLTERRDHLDALQVRFEKFAKNIVVLRGGMGTRERRAAEERFVCRSRRKGWCYRPDAFLGRDSAILVWTLCSWFHPFLGRERWLSTWGGSIANIKVNARCVCTTTWIRMFRCLPEWLRRGELDTRRSATPLSRWPSEGASDAPGGALWPDRVSNHTAVSLSRLGVNKKRVHREVRRSSGSISFSPRNRRKSRSVEHSVAPCSKARAASAASVTSGPLT